MTPPDPELVAATVEAVSGGASRVTAIHSKSGASAARTRAKPGTVRAIQEGMSKQEFDALKPGDKIANTADPAIWGEVRVKRSYGFELRMCPTWPTRRGRAINPGSWERVP